MTWKRCMGLGMALVLGASTAAHAQTLLPPAEISNNPAVPAARNPAANTPASGTRLGIPAAVETIVDDAAPKGKVVEKAPAAAPVAASGCVSGCCSSCAGDCDCGTGPTPLSKVGILQNIIYGDCADQSKIKFSGWADFDYTYRSTGHGINNVAPVMNRFGDEALVRQLGLYITKPLDPNCWSWGFNSIFIAGADASFLGPTAGGWANTNPRFGAQWTDLNLTIHTPILTEGGVDWKIGRQTTVFGPMGALPWQRYFTSSDYAWYNLEEGRYTGVSAVLHVNKQLDIYNGIEFGWGEFFDYYSVAPQYIGQINYWLDEGAEKTKVWTTVLTGPTGKYKDGNTTAFEFGFLHNWSKCVYQIVDFQCNYSKAQIVPFFPTPPGYQERAYDIYTYLGAHLTKDWDINSRFEWYRDVDGGGYPGGFGVPHTDYFAVTVGPDYHPTKWLQVRPEIRYDHATNPNFGTNNNFKNQLSIAVEALFKF